MVSSESYRTSPTEARRQAILHAALKSFASKGFTDTTMEDIRQLSGASTGSIYHHFENKEMLALALYREGRNDLNATLFQALDTPEPREGIQASVRGYLDWYERNADLGLYIIQAASTEYLGSQVEGLRQKLDAFPQRYFTWLAPFIEQGLIARYPQTLYVPLTLGPSREFIRRWLRKQQIEELHEAREPLAEAAWQVLSTSTK